MIINLISILLRDALRNLMLSFQIGFIKKSQSNSANLFFYLLVIELSGRKIIRAILLIFLGLQFS